MKLDQYLAESGVSQKAFARLLRIKQARLSHWVTGRYRVPNDMILFIEDATGNRVTRHDLLPEIYGKR